MAKSKVNNRRSKTQLKSKNKAKGSKKVGELLGEFGLEERERKVYLLLVQRGWSTVLQLSRLSGIKRTTMYRVLESLGSRGLVVTELDEKTTYYNAAEVKQFESLVIQKEVEAKKMRDSFVGLESMIGTLSGVGGKQTKVRFFRGVEGLQHMEWRMVERKNFELLIFGTPQWHETLGEEFAEEIRSEVVKNKITIREILNPREEIDFLVNEDGTASWTRNKEYLSKYYDYRLVDVETMKIYQDIMIYRNTIHLRGYSEDDVMGIEIVSVDYSEMFRQWFEVLWRMGGK